MTRSVLADTGPLYAAVDPHDSRHARALQDLQKLGQDKREVLVCYPTVLETYSLILSRLGANISLRWLAEIRAAKLLNPTPGDFHMAGNKLREFSDQRITLFDATLAVVAARSGLEVWTYDHHFDVMRCAVWR